MHNVKSLQAVQSRARKMVDRVSVSIEYRQAGPYYVGYKNGNQCE